MNRTVYKIGSPTCTIFVRVYPLPCQGVTKHGYTKHYFEGMSRICSKIGGGFESGLGGEMEAPPSCLWGDPHLLYWQQRGGVRTAFTENMRVESDVSERHDLEWRI